MTGDEAVQWIRNQCELHGHNFVVDYGHDGMVEVRVNDRFVLGFYRAGIQDFDPVHIARGYEVAALPPMQEANPNDHLWLNELPPLHPQDYYNLPAVDDGRFAMEGVWHTDDAYARQIPPEPEIDRGRSPLYIGDIIEGDLEDVHIPKIKSLKDREGKVAEGWIQGWSTLTASTLEIGNSVPMTFTYEVDEHGQIIGTRSIRAVLCKGKRHYVGEGVEFCEKCCWTCQAADEAPFCTSCRKTMRAEQKEGESIRSFASEHFPSLVPFLD